MIILLRVLCDGLWYCRDACSEAQELCEGPCSDPESLGVATWCPAADEAACRYEDMCVLIALTTNAHKDRIGATTGLHIATTWKVVMQ